MTNAEKRDSVLKWAESQLGVMEYPANSNKVKYNDWFYGVGKYGSGAAWCMAAVEWVFSHAGLPLPVKTASCTVLANYAKAHGQWVTSGYKPGDIVFFDWSGKRKITEHVGIVKSTSGTSVNTYEGNTSTANQSNGGCYMERKRTTPYITGAYRPWYNFV